MRWIYTVLGLGYFPYGPGTITSLATALVWLFLPGPALFWKLFGVGLVTLAGVFVSGRASTELGQQDPSCVVIDEVAGQMVALSFLPHTGAGVLVGFLLFRLFDIWKPWLIADLERLPGGFGIMADDLAAGLVAGILGALSLIAFGG